MTLLAFVALAVAGGLGLALGLLTALVAGHLLPPVWSLVAGAGFLGGYTTFSTNSYETVRLLGEKRYVASLANAVGTLLAAVVAAGLGYWVGSLF